MREIGSFLKRGRTLSSVFQEVIERLTPNDEIRALHTRAVANGENWYLKLSRQPRARSVGAFCAADRQSAFSSCRLL